MIRKVGQESSRTYMEKLFTGFFDKYMSGKGAEIGYAGYIEDCVPILEGCDGYDKKTDGYDGKNLPVPDNHYDYIYSSHTLEHIEDYKQALREWYRATKVNGYIVIVVPHQYLYEKKNQHPSNWNSDHRRFYSPSSLLKEVEDSLLPNSYRVKLLEDGDRDFDYSIPPEKHSGGQYEITLVLQKINKPSWDLM